MRPTPGRASKPWNRSAKGSGPCSAPTPPAAPRASASATTTGVRSLSDHFQAELQFLGIESSPAFVRAPEGNGCAERFIRTLKEQLLWVQPFATVEELRQALLLFKTRYNHEWLLERHRHRSPAAIRAAHGAALQAAA